MRYFSEFSPCSETHFLSLGGKLLFSGLGHLDSQPFICEFGDWVCGEHWCAIKSLPSIPSSQDSAFSVLLLCMCLVWVGEVGFLFLFLKLACIFPYTFPVPFCSTGIC